MQTLTIEANECKHSLLADRFAVYDDSRVAVVSAAGPLMAIRALAAAMQTNNGFAAVRCERCGYKDQQGYDAHRLKLGYNYAQVVLLSKRPGLLPSVTDNGLWLALKGEQYTTPLLRSWVPWIREELTRRNLLRRLWGVGCEAGVLVASDKELDEVVSDGVKIGILKVAKEAA